MNCEWPRATLLLFLIARSIPITSPRTVFVRILLSSFFASWSPFFASFRMTNNFVLYLSSVRSVTPCKIVGLFPGVGGRLVGGLNVTFELLFPSPYFALAYSLGAGTFNIVFAACAFAFSLPFITTILLTATETLLHCCLSRFYEIRYCRCNHR